MESSTTPASSNYMNTSSRHPRSRPARFSTTFGQSIDNNNPPFQHFDEDALYQSLEERVTYLRSFLNFTHDDVEALNDIVPLLEPLVEDLVDRVYAHLFTFDVTKSAFMPKPDDKDPSPILTDLHHLQLDAPQVVKRKKFFAVYIRKLVSADYDDFATWQYFGSFSSQSYFRSAAHYLNYASSLDKVGLMHTGEAALKHRRLAGKEGLYVDLMHLTALLAWTQDALIPVIMREPALSLERKILTVRSLSKVMWIQNDLFSRHYTVRSHDVKAVNSALKERDEDMRISKNWSSTTGSTDSGSREGSSNHKIGLSIDSPPPLNQPPWETLGEMSPDSESAPKKKSFMSRIGF